MDGVRTLEGGEEVTDAMVRARIRVDEGLAAVCRRFWGRRWRPTVAVVSEMAVRGHGKRRSRTGLARVGGDVGTLADGHRQAGSGMARNRARARLNWVSQGQRCGRCKVRRRVLVVTICSPRPIRAVQRARLWAITCTASQAALAAKRPEGRWFSPTPYLRSRMAFSISAWGRFSVSKPLSQKHGSTFLPLQDADPTPSFGGFGLSTTAALLCTWPGK